MEYAIINTPMGALQFVQEAEFITEIKYVGKYAVEVAPQTDLLKETVGQVESYFTGELKEFTLPLKLDVSPFRQKVLEELQKVPYGTTVSYKELAERVGNPKAVRAVGSAMRTNPVVLVVPCHRVVQTGGNLGNYSAGGPANKEWLLRFEKQNRQIFQII